MRRIAAEVAAEWELELGEPFALSRYSYVAPAGDERRAQGRVARRRRVAARGAVARAVGRRRRGAAAARDPARRALLEERAVPGDDISELPEEDATRDRGRCRLTALAAGGRALSLDRRPRPRWIDDGERDADEGSELIPLARELYAELDVGRETLIHGDFHHHNILRHGERFVAIDSKAMLGDPEYDIPSFLRNPLSFRMIDRDVIERRIGAFVAAGLDDFKIRAWTVIRLSYLGADPDEVALVRSLL